MSFRPAKSEDEKGSVSAGGTRQVMACGFGGFRVRNGQMTFKPWLQPGWKRRKLPAQVE
jgi:trehalose/maltose hydrolase-like predicted phosphorylase